MNYKLIAGYIIGIAGLVLPGMNAYSYLAKSDFNQVSIGASLLISVIGTLLIRKK